MWHTGLSGLRVLATLLLGHEAHAVGVEEVGGREAAEEEAHLVRGRVRVRVTIRVRVRVGVRVRVRVRVSSSLETITGH